MADYVTIRRWSLKPGSDEETLLSFVREGIAPAWREIPGCLSLNFLSVRGASSYLAVTYWQSKEAAENWAGAGGHDWREKYRGVLERWLELTTFQDETEADLLIVG